MSQKFRYLFNALVNNVLVNNVLNSNWSRLLLLGEIIALLLAALWLGQDYLSLNENLVPGGEEFHLVIQSHHFWTRLSDCGLCALWNGSLRGGFPALIELQGAILHPIVAITTLLLGVVNGAKYTLILSFFLAGIAQLWLGYELRVSFLPRLWAALVGLFGAHLSARMGTGLVQIILSTAMASFMFPAIIMVARRGHNRQAVLLGVILASLAVSGQGYIQIAFLFTLPAFLLLFINKSKREVWKKFVLAGMLATLLIGVFLVPLIHFGANLGKETNIYDDARQPIHYFLLNFVTNDLDFFYTDAFRKPALPALTALFIGWMPLLLTLFTFPIPKREDRPFIRYLFTSSLILILVGSGTLIHWLINFVPFLDIIRFPTLMAPLAVPPLLGVAAYNLDRFIKSDWKAEVRFGLSSATAWHTVNLKWLVAILLAWNVYNVANFSRLFTGTYEIEGRVATVLDSVETESAQWINLPTEGWVFMEPAIRRGLKISPMYLPYYWHFRSLPEPIINVYHQDWSAPEDYISSQTTWRYTLYKFDESREYAFIETPQGNFPCKATSQGGNINVSCDSDEAGELIIKENYWTGWHASRDGQAIDFIDANWLRVQAPAGLHMYEFRYLPMDVLIGALVTIFGMGLAIYLWIVGKRNST